MKECPECGLISSDVALECACGFSLNVSTKELEKTRRELNDQKARAWKGRLSIPGTLLLIAGAARPIYRLLTHQQQTYLTVDEGLMIVVAVSFLAKRYFSAA